MPTPNIKVLIKQLETFRDEKAVSATLNAVITNLNKIDSLSKEELASFLGSLKKWRLDKDLNIKVGYISLSNLLNNAIVAIVNPFNDIDPYDRDPVDPDFSFVSSSKHQFDIRNLIQSINKGNTKNPLSNETFQPHELKEIRQFALSKGLDVTSNADAKPVHQEEHPALLEGAIAIVQGYQAADEEMPELLDDVPVGGNVIEEEFPELIDDAPAGGIIVADETPELDVNPFLMPINEIQNQTAVHNLMTAILHTDNNTNLENAITEFKNNFAQPQVLPHHTSNGFFTQEFLNHAATTYNNNLATDNNYAFVVTRGQNQNNN